MSNTVFTIRQLEYFEAIAAEGSLSAAAKRCHVTPSALSLAIDDLERHLHLQLLVRQKARGVALTPAGSRMLTHARDVLDRAETLTKEASRETTSVSGRLAVGCFTTLTPFFAPPIVEKFERDYPKVDMQLSAAAATELHDHLMQGLLDVALLYSVDVPSTLSFDPLLTYRPHVLVAADHPLSNRRAVSLRDLIDEPLVLLDLPPAKQNTETIFAQLNLRPHLRHTSPSYETVRCFVGYGLGYAVMLQRPTTPHTYDGHEVRALELLDPVAEAVVGLARPKGAAPTARYDVLRSFVSSARMGGKPVP